MGEFSINANSREQKRYLATQSNQNNSVSQELLFGGDLEGFLKTITSDKNKTQYEKFLNIFDANGNGQIENDAIVDKSEISYYFDEEKILNPDISEKELLKKFFKTLTGSNDIPDNKMMKKLVDIINRIDDKQYSELKTYITAQNGKIPAWRETELGLVKSGNQKFEYLPDGVNYTKEQDFHEFNPDIKPIRERKAIIESTLTELSEIPGLNLNETKTDDGKTTKTITDESGREIYSATFSTSGDLIELKTYSSSDETYEINYFESDKFTAYKTKTLNEKGQILSEFEYYGGGHFYNCFYNYDDNGKLIEERSETDYSKKKTKYQYQGNVCSHSASYTITDDNQEILRFEKFYDKKGRETKTLSYSEDGSGSITSETVIEYDAKGFFTETEYGRNHKIKHIIKESENGTISTYYDEPRKNLILEEHGNHVKIYNSEKEIVYQIKRNDGGKPTYLDKNNNPITRDEVTKLLSQYDETDDDDVISKDGGQRPGGKIPIPPPDIEKGECPADVQQRWNPPTGNDFKEISQYLNLDKITEENIFDFDFIRFEYLNEGQIDNSGWKKIANTFLKVVNSPKFEYILNQSSTSGAGTRNTIKTAKALAENLKDERLTFDEKIVIIRNLNKTIKYGRTDDNFNNLDRPNGKIDKPSYQRDEGDCWFLETVNAFCRTENGKKIIEQCLSVDEKTGDVTVTLEGGHKKYKITAQELALSHGNIGDGDIGALVVAMGKNRNETRNAAQTTSNNPLWSGNGLEAIQIITGVSTYSLSENPGTPEVVTEDGNIPICVENRDKLKNKPFEIKASAENFELLKQFGKEVVIMVGLDHHEYSVQINDDGTLTLHEPWNSENNEIFTIDEIIQEIMKKWKETLTVMIL